MLEPAPHTDRLDIRATAEGLCGDFARGQRGVMPSHRTVPCDYATGLRHRATVPSTTGDFATGMRSVSPSTPSIGDFATGQRRNDLVKRVA